ncbi:MAG: winged helix-turn-helix transcriptional regulator [Nitrososphaerales archaeon]
MKPDGIDSKILEALMDDGRASLRQIARRTSLTTPTVSARMARMTKAGLIMKFVPILAADSVNRGVSALVTLGVDSTSAEKVAKDLARLKEVQNVYMTTGQSMTLKVALDGVRELQSFLGRSVFGRPGVKVTSSQIITSTIKEGPPSLVPSMLTMDLRCDYCHEEVARARPYTVVAGSSHYYFCCKTCKKDYLDKYGSRLAKIGRDQERKVALHA